MESDLINKMWILAWAIEGAMERERSENFITFIHEEIIPELEEMMQRVK
jgi:hypothetical protein